MFTLKNDIDPIDYIDYDEDDAFISGRQNNNKLSKNEIDAYEKILEKCTQHNSLDEVKIYEDLYDVDAYEAFENYVKIALV